MIDPSADGVVGGVGDDGVVGDVGDDGGVGDDGAQNLISLRLTRERR